MKKLVVMLALGGLMGCGNGGSEKIGPFMIDGKVSLILEQQVITLDLSEADAQFIDSTTPFSTNTRTYLSDGSTCMFNVFLQSAGNVNEYIITLESPLHQNSSCGLLEKSFLLQIQGHFVGTLTVL
jgi:hypothetical protein